MCDNEYVPSRHDDHRFPFYSCVHKKAYKKSSGSIKYPVSLLILFDDIKKNHKINMKLLSLATALLLIIATAFTNPASNKTVPRNPKVLVRHPFKPWGG